MRVIGRTVPGVVWGANLLAIELDQSATCGEPFHAGSAIHVHEGWGMRGEGTLIWGNPCFAPERADESI
jgi:hypothetical protein